MSNQSEIPTDDEVLAALEGNPEGLTPSALLEALGNDHSSDDIIRALQRVLDRGKVHLSDDAKLLATNVGEMAFA